MSQFTVERSLNINASTAKVWENIISFEKQQTWFPWYVSDPDAKVTLSGTDGELGASESWEGNIIGTGKRTNTNILAKEFLDQSIEWKNRFISQGRMYFSLQKCGSNCTTLLWGVQVQLPWYKWYMKNILRSQIALDLETGLQLLTDYTEGKPLPQIAHEQTRDQAEVFTLGIEKSSSKEDIGPMMQSDFQTLWSYVTKHKIPSHGARSYYMNVNMRKNVYAYRSSIILSPDAFMEIGDTELPDGIKPYYYPAGKIYSLRLTGSYSYLGFAWGTLFRFFFHKKIKFIKKYPMYEDYVNDPAKTPEHKRMTDICAYVK